MKRIGLILFTWLTWFCAMSLQAQRQYPLDTIDGAEYYRYTVENSIGLYRISRNFGVTQEQILEANPSILRQGIRCGEVILIPTLRKVSAPVIPVPTVPVTPLSPDTTDSIIPAPIDSMPILRIAVLLPLQAEVQKRQKAMDRFYDFYTGILLAVNEIQNSGVRLELYVYDTGKTASDIPALMAEEGIQNADAVIGPAFVQQVEEAAKWMTALQKPFVIPFTNAPNAILDNPYLYQFNPSERLEADSLATYLSKRADSVNCILIEAEKEKIPESIAILRKSLVAHDVPTTTTTIHAILVDSFDVVLQRDKENIFLFNTERYANIRALIPHLTAASNMASVTLLSRYSWQKESVSLPQLYTTIFHTSVASPASYQQAYNRYFAHTLSSTMPRYDLLGYDIMHQLAKELLIRKGLAEEEGDSSHPFHGVQSDILYKQSQPNNGYENAMIHIVHK